MKPEDKEVISKFLSNSNPSIAKQNKLALAKVESYVPDYDIILGISMNTIKDFIKTCPVLEVGNVFKLIQSEYNEARILGWSLLIRDYSETSILRYFALYQSENCGNWNVVDFAAPLCSKMLMKREDRKHVEEIGYELLFKQTNIWTTRFALMLSLPLIKKDNLNYAIDSVERSLDNTHSTVHRACGIVLREVGSQNMNILSHFLKDNYRRINPIIKDELKKLKATQ